MDREEREVEPEDIDNMKKVLEHAKNIGKQEKINKLKRIIRIEKELIALFQEINSM